MARWIFASRTCWPGTGSAETREDLFSGMLRSPSGAIDDRPQFSRNMLFHNRGDGTFEEVGSYAGVTASGWSWQPVFLDVDLDGYEGHHYSHRLLPGR